MTPEAGLFQVTLGSATFGVVVVNGIVESAAPFAKWCIGKPWEHARQWFVRKGGKLERVTT